MKPSRARAVEADRLEVEAVLVAVEAVPAAAVVSVAAEAVPAAAAAVLAVVAAAADAHTRLVRKPRATHERIFLTPKFFDVEERFLTLKNTKKNGICRQSE
jgi:hypothetical protein